MDMDHTQYLELQSQLQDHFDGRYVRIEDCEKTSGSIEKCVSRNNVRLAVIEQQNKLMLWILAAVTSGIITILVKMFVGV